MKRRWRNAVLYPCIQEFTKHILEGNGVLVNTYDDKPHVTCAPRMWEFKDYYELGLRLRGNETESDVVSRSVEACNLSLFDLLRLDGVELFGEKGDVDD